MQRKKHDMPSPADANPCYRFLTLPDRTAARARMDDRRHP